MKTPKPTPRQVWLMGFAKRPHSFWRVSDMRTSMLIRPYIYQDPNRGPSRPELDKLLALGWVVLEVDPNVHTTNTKTGERRAHHRVFVTGAGLSAIGVDPPAVRRFATWKEAHKAAVNLARWLNKDVGIERMSEFGKDGYNISSLPGEKYRFGHELRCEVVKPTDPL